MKMKHKMITLAAVFLASVCSFGFGGRAEAAGATIGEGILANDAGDVAPWISGLGYAK